MLWAARRAPYATDEITLARQVEPALQKGMLCLADRFFPSYQLWQAAAKNGADLLWRMRQNARLLNPRGVKRKMSNSRCVHASPNALAELTIPSKSGLLSEQYCC